MEFMINSRPVLWVTRPSCKQKNKQKAYKGTMILKNYLEQHFLKRHRDFSSGWKLVWMFIFLIVSVEKKGG